MPDQPPQNAPYGHDGTQPAPTAPPTLTWLQNGTQGRNEWADGYAAAKRFYGDSAPIDLDWLQEQVDDISTIRSPLDRRLAAEGLVLSGEIDELIAEVHRLRATIAAADDLHPYELDPDPEIEAGVTHWCDTCDEEAHCQTHRALHPEETS